MEQVYRFANEKVVVQVDERWEKVLRELDRVEYNNHQTARRHQCSLSAVDQDGDFLAAKDTAEPACVVETEYERLGRRIHALSPDRQRLLFRYFWLKKSQKELAAEEGVTTAAISARLQTIYRQLKKNYWTDL